MTTVHRCDCPQTLPMSSRICSRLALLRFSAFTSGLATCLLTASGLSFCQELPIEIGSSRIVYNENQPSATVSVRNKSDIPYLVSINVTEFCGEGKQCPSTDDFMASPGFRVIRPGESFPFRLVKLIDSLPTNYESLYLVKFLLLPSDIKLTQKQIESPRVTFTLAGTLKLFWRPKALANVPGAMKTRDMLAANCTDSGMTIHNRSAYWGTISVLDANDQSLLKDGPLPMIAPFSDRHFDLNFCPRSIAVALLSESGLSTSARFIPVRSLNKE